MKNSVKLKKISVFLIAIFSVAAIFSMNGKIFAANENSNEENTEQTRVATVNSIFDIKGTNGDYKTSSEDSNIYLPYLRNAAGRIVVDKSIDNIGVLSSASTIDVNEPLKSLQFLISSDSVRINANLEYALVLSANDVVINSNIEKNALIFAGGTVTVDENATIGDDVIIVAKAVNIKGKISKSAVISANNLNVSGSIEEDLRCEINTLDISENDNVKGNLFVNTYNKELNIKDKYPIITVTRRKINDKAMYFGPYTNVGAMKESLASIKEIFPVKRCRYNLEKKKLTRPCLYYHIGRCLGPCINDVSREEYKEMINQIVMFLQGKNSEIKDEIKKQMDEEIEKLEFEKAAKLKKRLDDIEKISLKQKVGNLNETSTDIFGYVHHLNQLYVQVFKIRDYKVVLHDNVILNDISKDEVTESIESIVSNYYLDNKDIPKKVYVKLDDENIELLNEFFEKKQIKLDVTCPKKGDKAKLINMVENNIQILHQVNTNYFQKV